MSSAPSAPGTENAQAVQLHFELTTSRRFPAWLADLQGSLVFITYQAGKVFFIGLQPDGRLSIFERTLERVMGLHASPSTFYQIWRFENVLGSVERFGRYDAVYTPRESRVIGELDVHDIAVDEGGRGVFSNTRFNCLASTDADHSLRPCGSRRRSRGSCPRIAATSTAWRSAAAGRSTPRR